MNAAPTTAFIRAYPPSQPAFGPAIWLPFFKGELLVPRAENDVRLYQGGRASLDALNLEEPIYLGTLGETPCLAAEVEPDTEIPDGWASISLRTLFGQVSDAEYAIAGYASQMLYWRRTSGFCPVCGHRTMPKEGDWGRRCPECGHVAYPHVTPATLILVHDGPRLLLGHKPGWGTRYSILAGFAEPGESLEECVHREVSEEVGLQIDDLAYAGSQPWPYPHQLMIGFTARYVSGEIQVDGEEIDHAAWFTPDNLPDLPPNVSLSRQMIDHWLAKQRMSNGRPPSPQ